jgi:hypothetical protein
MFPRFMPVTLQLQRFVSSFSKGLQETCSGWHDDEWGRARSEGSPRPADTAELPGRELGKASAQDLAQTGQHSGRARPRRLARDLCRKIVGDRPRELLKRIPRVAGTMEIKYTARTISF